MSGDDGRTIFGDERLPARFWAKVTADESGCWLWTGYATRNGYGRVSVGGKMYGAHRVAYEALTGPIPSVSSSIIYVGCGTASTRLAWSRSRARLTHSGVKVQQRPEPEPLNAHRGTHTTRRTRSIGRAAGAGVESATRRDARSGTPRSAVPRCLVLSAGGS